MNYRKIWEEANGPLPEGFEIHHRLPKRLGGTDELENLEALTRKEHAKAHFRLYEKFGDIKDLQAYYMLSGEFEKGRKFNASIGGKKGGKLTHERGIGIHGYPEKRSEWASIGGKAGAASQIRDKKGIHTDDNELRRKWAVLGGKSGSFTKSEIQSELGKRGGVKNRGAIWITDGKMTMKYTASMQENLPIEAFLDENPQYRRGRK